MTGHTGAAAAGHTVNVICAEPAANAGAPLIGRAENGSAGVAFLFRRPIYGGSISFDLRSTFFPQLSSRVADTLQPIGMHMMAPARKKCRAG